MFCPKCGSKNLEDAKFCRACGVDISLVPGAITGKIKKNTFGFEPVQPKSLQSFGNGIEEMFDSWGSCGVGGGKRSEPSVDRAIINLFLGVGFICVAFALALFGQAVQGHRWWFWMMIPAFALLGGGVAEIVRLRYRQRPLPPRSPRTKARRLPASPPRHRRRVNFRRATRLKSSRRRASPRARRATSIRNPPTLSRKFPPRAPARNSKQEQKSVCAICK